MKPKLLFIYDLPKEHVWMDGLWAALQLLEDEYNIMYHNLSQEPGFPDTNASFILGWGAFGSRVDALMEQISQGEHPPLGLCVAGCATLPTKTEKYSVLFYETKWYRDQIKFHPNIVHAFGVNTEIFCPAAGITPIVWDYIGVGAFADWKRWGLMKNKKGNRLVVGYYQENNKEESGRIAEDLILDGVMVANQVNPFDLVNYYHWSRTAYVPASVIGGGERTVLEARSCGLEVEVEDDNPKLKELVEGQVYSHEYYAQQLIKGIRSV